MEVVQALPSPTKCRSILTLVPYKELDYKSGGHWRGDRKSASGPVQHPEVQQPLYQAPIPMRQVSCSEELGLAGLGLPDNGHTPHPHPPNPCVSGGSSCKEEWTEKCVCGGGGGVQARQAKENSQRDAPSCCPSMLGIQRLVRKRGFVGYRSIAEQGHAGPQAGLVLQLLPVSAGYP